MGFPSYRRYCRPMRGEVGGFSYQAIDPYRGLLLAAIDTRPRHSRLGDPLHSARYDRITRSHRQVKLTICGAPFLEWILGLIDITSKLARQITMTKRKLRPSNNLTTHIWATQQAYP